MKNKAYIHIVNNPDIISSKCIKLYHCPEIKDTKICIWNKELCDGAEWVDFIKCVEEKAKENAILERALKLACECVNTTYAKPFGNDVDYTDYFIHQAEKELKDE